MEGKVTGRFLNVRWMGGGGGDGCQQNLVQALGHLRVTIGYFFYNLT